MSTLSGNATKGEKGKKFQQLKINLCAANKPTEPEQQQHKSSIQRKQHGMTSLGKVPTARRPTNLPSEKSEHSGNDPSVNLVPSGGAGWGNKPNESGTIASTSLVQSTTPTNISVNSAPITGTSQQVQHAQHYPPSSRMSPMSQMGHTVHHGHADVKTWAMMTQGGDSSAPNFLAPQSPLFQHEFPSLSSNSETTSSSTLVTVTASQKPLANAAADTQYGPGPSLRPQTEGSWIQGGSRPQGSVVPTVGNASAAVPAPVRPVGPYPPHLGPDGVRNNLAPSGVGVVPGGPYPAVMPQQHMIPPQYSGMMPPFMLRNSYPGGFPPNFQPSVKGVGPRPPYSPYVQTGGPHAQPDRFTSQSGAGANTGKRLYDDEDVKIRSIIKEEDLNQMATIGNDIGWAGHEDIDYNQKLKFSDDEDDEKNKENRSKTRARLQPSSKANDKISEWKDDKENDLRNSKESLKEREKLFSADARNPEVRNAWHLRRTILSSTPSTARYQIPGPGRFEDDDEALQEKRRQKKEEMEIIMQRAKERKEEEEKRFIEQQQAASLKLQKLEAEIRANQSGNKENKMPYGNDRDVDMLPDWEKEKLKTQNRLIQENQNNEDTRKVQNAVPVPVVKDASEFRELTQLLDRSNFVKKDTKERENAPAVFSRTYTNNIPPRFQNLNRQNSGGFSSGSSTSGSSRTNVTQQSQFSGKCGSQGFTAGRRGRVDSDSLSDMDRDWVHEESHKERDIDRYSKESSQEREDRKYENKFGKEYDLKRKFYNEKDEYTADSYSREFEKENLVKIDRKNSENEREKSKTYDFHRYSDNENQEKESRWRMYDESTEKTRSFTSGCMKLVHAFSENENRERKNCREESYENARPHDADREREFYRKSDFLIREKDDIGQSIKSETREGFRDSKKETENDLKRDHDLQKNRDTYKEREKKSPSPYDDRHSRNELRESRFHRESRDSLRDDAYAIQEVRLDSWVDDAEIEEKTKIRREHYREDRGDRYSHAQRHPPGPITRAKLEAKELESDSKRNLTALVRSDKKPETKKPDAEDSKEKEKVEKSTMKTEAVENSSISAKPDLQNDAPTVWKKDDRKGKDDSKSSQNTQSPNEHASEVNATKDDKKESSKSGSRKGDEFVEKGVEDKKGERRKNDRRNKADPRNWVRYSVYHQNPYGSLRSDAKLRKSSRGANVKGSLRRESKYSESDYSDEVSGSGREDRNSRTERKSWSVKVSSKRYDNRSRDYGMDDRDYGSNRGRNNRDTYYYNNKQAPRNRGGGGGSGFRNNSSISKRSDAYGPPPAKNSFGAPTSHSEEKRQKSSTKESTPVTDHGSTEKKVEPAPGKSNLRSSIVDRSWKKNYENIMENKSAVSSPTSMQTAEANEESFATASEGTDSEDNLQIQKSKQNSSATKRIGTIVVTKPQKKNFSRSTSRKRYEIRRAAASYSPKDSTSYPVAKRTSSNNIGKGTAAGKECEKRRDGENEPNKGDAKPLTSPKEFSDNQNKRNVKPRNRSNSRKNSRIGGGLSSGRSRTSQDVPPRMQLSLKADGRVSGEKESKGLDISLPYFKEVGPPIPAPPPPGNAWDKPLTGALRNGSPSTQKSVSVGSSATSQLTTTNTMTTVIVQEKSIVQITEKHSESSPVSSEISANTLSAEKVTTKVLENLDGATPPVQTIIFENTNYKSSPADLSSKGKYSSQLKSHRYEKEGKLVSLDSNVSGFCADSSSVELPNKQDPLQMALSFNKSEDCTDMKLDFAFDSLADEKSAKTMELTHAMHMVASTDADLNFKIASVKKVWDGLAAEHFDEKYEGGIVNTSASFSPSFSNHSSDHNNGSCYGNSHVENSGHVQVDDGLGHGEVVFSPVSQIQAVNSTYGSSSNCQPVVMKNDATSTSSNVCKVKPQPQGTSMASVAQSSVISTTLVSQPPPLSSPSYNAFSCSTPQPNLSNSAAAASALAQIGFQQYSIPPVASSPVLYNSSQTAAPAGAGVYQAFQIDNSQVASRSPFGQFASYGLSSAAIGQTSGFNHQQSVFVQPPTNAPPPEIYSAQVPQYRLPPQAFGNTQQITSQNTVLISSSSNSLMSATIKPSSQQISAIGTKAAGFQATQTSPQIYIPFDPATQLFNQNFLPGAGQLLPRPASNVVPPPSLQASTSYYSSASGAGQTGFFPPGTNSTMQAQPSAIGLTAFNTQSASQSLGPANLQNFNSQLTQQYRSAPASYLTKSGNSSSITSDFASNKPLSIPNQHDVLSFQTSSQMSNKQRMQSGGKNVPNAQAMGQHSMSQSTYGYQRNNGGANKGSQYPHPIQRPVSQGNNSNRGGNNASGSTASHRMPVRSNSHQLVNNIQQPPSSVYYSSSSGFSNASKLESSQLDSKTDSNVDSKLADSIKTINAKNSSSASEKNISHSD